MQQNFDLLEENMFVTNLKLKASNTILSLNNINKVEKALELDMLDI